MTAPALLVDEVAKVYRTDASIVQALCGVSLSVRTAEVVALLGNNGAGKSTLLDIVAGLIDADRGTVSIFGRSPNANDAGFKHEIGYAPQSDAVYPTLTVRQNLNYFGQLCGLRKRALAQRVEDLAAQLLIADLVDRRASTLSGGQRRRLHIALAMVHRPPLLMLDEPSVGLDVEARDELLDFIRRTAAAGTAVLCSTHHLQEVEDLDARVVLIDEGRVLAEGSVADLVAEHARPTAVLRFVRSELPLSADLLAAVDEAGWTDAGDYRVVLTLPSSDIRVGEIVDQLSDQARTALTSATVRPPSLEQAYHGLLRAARGRSGVRSVVSDGDSDEATILDLTEGAAR